MKDSLEYQVNKCLEKIHEVDIKVTTINNILDQVQDNKAKIAQLETRSQRLMVMLIAVLSSIGGYGGFELVKLLKVIV